MKLSKVHPGTIFLYNEEYHYKIRDGESVRIFSVICSEGFSHAKSEKATLGKNTDVVVLGNDLKENKEQWND